MQYSVCTTMWLPHQYLFDPPNYKKRTNGDSVSGYFSVVLWTYWDVTLSKWCLSARLLLINFVIASEISIPNLVFLDCNTYTITPRPFIFGSIAHPSSVTIHIEPLNMNWLKAVSYLPKQMVVFNHWGIQTLMAPLNSSYLSLARCCMQPC